MKSSSLGFSKAISRLHDLGILLMVLMLTSSVQAGPMESAFDSVPHHFANVVSTGSQAFGGLCLSMASMPNGSVCNPAFLPEISQSLLFGQVYVGNGSAALRGINKYLNQPITKGTLQELFENQNRIAAEAQAQLVFVTPYFSASFSPYRVQYFSEAHNPNFPVVAVHAARENELAFSGGMPLAWLHEDLHHLTLGARLRILHRDYIHGSFSFFDVLGSSSDTKALLPVQSQSGVLISPSMGWTSSEIPWRPRISLEVNNIGGVWPSDALYPDLLDLNLGMGIEPQVGFGRLRLGLDLNQLNQPGDFIQKAKFGSAYQFGILETLVGINQDAFSTGIQFGLNFIQAGIVYYFPLGRMDGAPDESKIATEVSIQL